MPPEPFLHLLPNDFCQKTSWICAYNKLQNNSYKDAHEHMTMKYTSLAENHQGANVHTNNYLNTVEQYHVSYINEVFTPLQFKKYYLHRGSTARITTIAFSDLHFIQYLLYLKRRARAHNLSNLVIHVVQEALLKFSHCTNIVHAFKLYETEILLIINTGSCHCFAALIYVKTRGYIKQFLWYWFFF